MTKYLEKLGHSSEVIAAQLDRLTMNKAVVPGVDAELPQGAPSDVHDAFDEDWKLVQIDDGGIGEAGAKDVVAEDEDVRDIGEELFAEAGSAMSGSGTGSSGAAPTEPRDLRDVGVHHSGPEWATKGGHLPLGVVGFVTSISRGGWRRLRRLHGCSRAPGLHYADFECLGEEMPANHLYDDRCRDCWRLRREGRSSASSASPSTSSYSSRVHPDPVAEEDAAPPRDVAPPLD